MAPVSKSKIVNSAIAEEEERTENLHALQIQNLFKLNAKPSRSGLGLFATRDMLVKFNAEADELWQFALENAVTLGLRVEESFRGDAYLLKVCKI